MKAIIYGPPNVLHFAEVEQPSPKGDEVLVKIRNASVNAPDWRLMRADPWPPRPQRTPLHDQ